MHFLKIFLLSLAFICPACAVDPVFERGFAMTAREIERAKIGFGLSKYEALYLMMVDRSGKVVKIKLLDFKEPKVEKRIAIRFKSILYQFEFYEAKPEEPDYREFIYPMNIKNEFEFR